MGSSNYYNDINVFQTNNSTNEWRQEITKPSWIAVQIKSRSTNAFRTLAKHEFNL